MDDHGDPPSDGYEYPDPELVHQAAYRNWPTGDPSENPDNNAPDDETVSGEEDEYVEENQAIADTHDWHEDPVDEDYDDQEASSIDEDHSSNESDSGESFSAPVCGRGRGRPRGRPPGRGRGGLRRMSSEEAEDHPRNHRRRKPRTVKKGDKTIIKRGIRKTLPPSAKYQKLLGDATNCFIQGDYAEAERLANEAIVENIEQFSAHSLLSEIFYTKGELEDSIATLFTGAHVRQRDPEVWEKVAGLILERTGNVRLPKLLKDAIYCYSRVLAVESDRIDIRVARAGLYRELGKTASAIRDLEYVLRKSSRNISVLKMLIETQKEADQPTKACKLYEELIDLVREQEPVLAESFDWVDLHGYSEMLIKVKEPAEGLRVIKRIARWICGRGQDNYWEFETVDDREFDVEPDRRTQANGATETRHDDSTYGEALPLEIRVHMGLLRLQQDDVEEASRHFEHLQPDDQDQAMVQDFADLYYAVGEACQNKKLYGEALRFLVPLSKLPDPTDSGLTARLAQCYRQVGQLDQAEICYRTLLQQTGNDSRVTKDMVDMFTNAELGHRAVPYKADLVNKRKRKYRPMFTNQGNDDRIAFQMPRKGVIQMLRSKNDLQQSDQIAGHGNIELVDSVEDDYQQAKRPRRQHHRRKAALAEDQEDLQTSFLQLADFKRETKEGNVEAREKWMSLAGDILEIFREARVFFPFDRGNLFYGYTPEARAKSALSKMKRNEFEMELAETLHVPVDQLPEDDIPDEFCHVLFKDWLDLFLEFAIKLSEDGRKKEAYSILDIANACNVFYVKPEYEFRIHLTSSVCALLLEDDEKLSTTGRWFMTARQFNSDAYRLYSALFRICPRPNISWFNSGIIQKFVMRQLKAVDFCLAKLSEQHLPMFTERSGFFNKDEEDNPILATRLDIGLLFLYGQILYAAGSYLYALNYFYRARSLDPTHPLINMCLGLSYIHHAIKRQALNRHQMIMQGLFFLFQYHDRRMKSESTAERQEATYNIGRTWHLLGLVHLAVPRYEKVLEMERQYRRELVERNASEGELENHETFAVDAAFALQGLYAIAGNMVRAKEVVDEWMVL